MPAWKKICCGVDFSEESRFAMEQAAQLAATSRGELTLVHVVAARPPYASGLPPRTRFPAADTSDPARRLEEWRLAAEAAADVHVSSALLTGAPADELLAFAREARSDLVVLGTPAAMGCERIVFGSVAESVIRRAPCSVVVARRPVNGPR